jgi:hypothetical protein
MHFETDESAAPKILYHALGRVKAPALASFFG